MDANISLKMADTISNTIHSMKKSIATVQNGAIVSAAWKVSPARIDMQHQLCRQV